MFKTLQCFIATTADYISENMDVSKRKRSGLLDHLNIMFTVFRSLNLIIIISLISNYYR